MIKFILRWLAHTHRPAPQVLSDVEQARALITAIDAGGIPLNPARVNHLARALGLEVSRQARMEETIARIRAALTRLDQGY